MQMAHLANLTKLFNEEKLILAGPLNDPNGVRRGIAAVLAPDISTAQSYFKADPYIQSGTMTINLRVWDMPVERLNSKIPDPNTLEENRLVFLESKRKVPTYLAKNRPKLTPVSGSLGGELEIVEVLLFPGTDDAGIRTRLQQDPLVHLGYSKIEMMPLYIAKGVLSRS